MKAAQRLEDLVAWQLACALRDLIFRMLGGDRVRLDFLFRDQIRSASASVPANLAEGFGRYYPRVNANHVRIAKGSLTETQSHLKDGRGKQYWKDDDFAEAWALSCRTMGAIVGYLRYLENCDNKVPSSRHHKRGPNSRASNSSIESDKDP
jgi:four helix bundle protein